MQEPGRSQKAQVRLLPSEESVAVRVKDLGEADERPAKEERRERQQPPGELADQQDAAPAGRDGGGQSEAPWLRPHIRVKIVDKRLGKGRCELPTKKLRACTVDAGCINERPVSSLL